MLLGSLLPIEQQRGSPRYTTKKRMALRGCVGRRWRVLTVASIVALLCVVQICSSLHGQVDKQVLSQRGVLRFNVPEARYQQAAAAKASMPRTQMFAGVTPDTFQQHLPVWVISLARAPHRRTAMAESLAAAGVTNYELVDAVDYHNASSLSQEHMHRYLHGWRRYMWAQNRTYYSSKLAVDLSHFRLWEHVAASDQPALILEDDVRLSGANWTRDVLAVLNELPEDWDMFYLGATSPTVGSNVSQHLLPVFGTAGAFAYVMTPAFARRAVAAAADPRQNTWVDLMLLLMARHFDGAFYLASPQLVEGSNLPTTLSAHYSESPSASWWERLWMRSQHRFVGRRRRVM